MYFSIILGALVITTEEIESLVILTEIVAYELVNTDDGGILSITLKGNHEELIYHCKGKKAWDNVLQWFRDYQNEMIEGITQAIAKNNKKTRF